MRAITTLPSTFAFLTALGLLHCGGGSGSTTVPAAAPPPAPSGPVTAITVAPGALVINQPAQFTDASTGGPTAWAWSFGDGGTSTQQNPIHTYAATGTYSVALKTTGPLGASTAALPVNVGASTSAGLGAFHGSVVLGAPTASSIQANLFSVDQSGTVVLQYGTATGSYDHQSAAVSLMAGTPVIVALSGLASDTRYYYRLAYQAPNGIGSGPTAEYTFHTARPAGSTFSFSVQADSHMDENSDLNVYQRTLGNVRSRVPDFHVDLGDTFMCEKHAGPLTPIVAMAPDQATVNARYVYERSNFGLATHSAPLFLVNGNHEGEAGWLLNGTAQNIAIWTTLARQRYYANPVPDAFYSGDPVDEPYVGKRASWYAWTWGDAQFIVLDPFWNTLNQGTDGWALTLGSRQYQWLQQTLAASTSPFKFVFIHNLVGGLTLLGNWRGGVEAAPFFEWGGKNLDGTEGFSQKRPGWAMPIHQLLVKYGVTAVFHGHDHLYAKQVLDGVVYQEVPQPSAVNSQGGAQLAADYHYLSGTILSSSGHLRVTVGPTGVTAEYVRTWLPGAETASRVNGQVDDTWSVSAPAPLKAR